LIKKSWTYTLIATAVMLLATIVGFLFPQLFEQQVLSIIRSMLLQLEGLDTNELIIFIFLNNLKATFFAVVLGMFVGVFSIIMGIVNGYVIGFTMNMAVSESGVLILWRLIPHGIFEIPAILLSMGVGFYLGSRFLEKRFKIKSAKKRIKLIGLFSVIAVVFGLIYYYLSAKFLLDGALSIGGSNIFVLVIISIINLALIGMFGYVLVVFFKNKELKRDLMDSLIFFVLIIIPLLLIAGIIEGILVGVVG